MFKVGDKVVVVDTGEVGVVTEVMAYGCTTVLLEGWDEACQVQARQLARVED